MGFSANAGAGGERYRLNSQPPVRITMKRGRCLRLAVAAASDSLVWQKSQTWHLYRCS